MEYSDQTGNDVILIVRRVNLHTGLNMFIGNRYSTSFFMQTGFDDVVLSKTDGTNFNTLNFEDWYILIEPRFMLSQFQLHVSMFNIPSDSLSNMIYLKGLYNSDVTNVLGVNAAIITDLLYLGNTNFTFGIHGTLAMANPLEGFSGEFSEFGNFMVSTYITGFLDLLKAGRLDLNITPFVKMPVFGGELTTSAALQVLEFASDWRNAIILTTGFKTKI